MRQRSVVPAWIVIAVALSVMWAPVMAQNGDLGPVVDWPCESRFVTEPVSGEETARMEWPSEIRYIELRAFVPITQGTLADVQWPCESRFVMPAAQSAAEIQAAWPSEARFIASAPIMPGELLVQIGSWPSEARYLDVAGYASTTDTSPDTASDTVSFNKQIYRDVVDAFFADDDAQPLFSHYPAALAQVRMEEWLEWQHAFDNLEATLDFQIAEGDRVLSCWTFTGIHNHDFIGVDATGKTVSFRVLYAGRFIDGALVEEISEMELEPLLKQLDARLVAETL